MNLPNPFEFTGASHAPVDKAVASNSTPVPEAAADPFECRFVLDEAAFMADLEPLPAFLIDPSQPYLRATEIAGLLGVIAGDSFLADIEPIRAAIARR